MRGGKFQQRSPEDSHSRNAESLFESRSVSEIREVEAQTRAEIEVKKEELRQLVGASYRDLIQSADSILNMKRSCEAVVSNIAAMEQSFAGLHSSVSKSVKAVKSDDSRKKREIVYCLGTRVKYLVDTPEKIWGCLDEHMYLEAAERFLRAETVHSLLLSSQSESENGKSNQLLAKFPLLSHQWPLVETFRTQIGLRSRERLQETGLGVQQYAVALAGIAVIEKMNGNQILSLFLDSRRAWVKSQLRSAPRLPDPSSVAAVLSRLVQFIQVSMCHLGELFLETSSPGRQLPRLFGTVLKTAPGSQLFGGIPSPDAEMAAWEEQRGVLEESMAPLSAAAVTEACRSWLTAVSDDVAVDSRSVLDAIPTAQLLQKIEDTVRQSMADSSTFAPSLPWLTAAFGSTPDSPWDAALELLLRQPLDLWNLLFEKPVVEAARKLLDRGLAEIRVSQKIQDLLQGEEASWKNPGEEGVVAGDLPWKFPEEDQARGVYLSPQVNALREEVDEKLLSLLSDIVHILQPGTPSHSSRTGEIPAHFQQGCMAAVHAIITQLQCQLAGLEAPSPLEQITVERSLLIGRFSFALGQHSQSLPLILGPVANWTASPGQPRQSGAIRSLSRRGRDFPASSSLSILEDSQKLREIQSELLKVNFCAFRVWVEWSTGQMARAFERDLGADVALSATSARRGWEETVQKSATEDGEVEMRISLPAMASQYCLSLLFAGVKEIHRIGSHTLDKSVLQLFAWKLSEQVLMAYESFVADEERFKRQVSEKGLLQLLFDVRFVADVLSGGSNVSPDSLQEPDSPAGYSPASRVSMGTRFRTTDPSIASRKARVSALIDQLLHKLDPVDAAMYEEQLWENERKYYQRTSVLYGTLIQLHRMYNDTQPRHPHASDTNTLDMSPVLPRFAHLPISAPVLPTSTVVRGARFSMEDVTAASDKWTASRNGTESSYSFGDLGLGFSTKSNPILKSIMGQVGGGALGRNISSLGEMLPSQAAGLFSSLTVGTS